MKATSARGLARSGGRAERLMRSKAEVEGKRQRRSDTNQIFARPWRMLLAARAEAKFWTPNYNVPGGYGSGDRGLTSTHAREANNTRVKPFADLIPLPVQRVVISFLPVFVEVLINNAPLTKGGRSSPALLPSCRLPPVAPRKASCKKAQKLPWVSPRRSLCFNKPLKLS
jgi:hypothetical protein